MGYYGGLAAEKLVSQHGVEKFSRPPTGIGSVRSPVGAEREIKTSQQIGHSGVYVGN